MNIKNLRLFLLVLGILGAVFSTQVIAKSPVSDSPVQQTQVNGVCVDRYEPTWVLRGASDLTAEDSLQTIESVATFENGEKYRMDDLTIVVLRGTWKEMGRQYGGLLQDELKKTWTFSNLKATKESDAFFSLDGTPCGLAFIDDLFYGAAETSGLSITELIRCNGVEVAYGAEVPSYLKRQVEGNKCSALAIQGERTEDGKHLFGRNYDWLLSFSELSLVLSVFLPSDGTPAVASLNFAGCFYLTSGMNSEGVFLALNSGMFASSDYDGERIHNVWLLWTVLQQARDSKQALRLLNSLYAAGNYIIGVADSSGAAAFEWATSAPNAVVEESEPGILAMSNHFMQPGWKNLPDASGGGDFSSVARRNALLRLAKALPPNSTLNDFKQLLSVEVAQGGAKWKDTLFQIIAVPAEKRLLIRSTNSQDWLDIPWTTLPQKE